MAKVLLTLSFQLLLGTHSVFWFFDLSFFTSSVGLSSSSFAVLKKHRTVSWPWFKVQNFNKKARMGCKHQTNYCMNFFFFLLFPEKGTSDVRLSFCCPLSIMDWNRCGITCAQMWIIVCMIWNITKMKWMKISQLLAVGCAANLCAQQRSRLRLLGYTV